MWFVLLLLQGVLNRTPGMICQVTAWWCAASYVVLLLVILLYLVLLNACMLLKHRHHSNHHHRHSNHHHHHLLPGTDVARKVIILARECGLPLSMEALAVDGLVPDELAVLPTAADYLKALPQVTTSRT